MFIGKGLVDMKKSLLTLLAAAAMGVVAAGASNAQLFRFTYLGDTDFTTAGISTTGGGYTASFTPGAPEDVSPVPFSNLTLGLVGVSNTGGTTTEAFNYNSGSPATTASALVHFEAQQVPSGIVGDPTGGQLVDFIVEGTLSGTEDIATSTALITDFVLRDRTNGLALSSVFVVNGNNYVGGNTSINGIPVFIGVRRTIPLSVPGGNTSSYEGVLTAPLQVVPEPGTYAMLAGSGFGILLLLKRRRA